MRSVEEHLSAILAAVRPVPSARLPLAECFGLVTAAPFASRVDLPGFDNSSMDGYAVRSLDCLGAAALGAEVTLRVVGEQAAGVTLELSVGEGEAVAIMTGAAMPAGADAVVPVEGTRTVGDQVILSAESVGTVAPERFVRRRGEDVWAGAQVVDAGTVVDERVIGLVAGCGGGSLEVHRALRVVVLSTGAELVSSGGDLAPGQIFDANGPMLVAALRRRGVRAELLAVLDDDVSAVQSTLSEVAGRDDIDAIVTTGGVSMGAYDVVKAAIAEHLEFVQVSMQPGKPQGFGLLPRAAGGETGIPVFALPGNPVSALVSFEVFVRPALDRLAGLPAQVRRTELASVTAPLKSFLGRRQFARVVLSRSASGELRAAPLTGQGSHFLGDLAAANGLLIVPEEIGHVDMGDRLPTIALVDDIPSA